MSPKPRVLVRFLVLMVGACALLWLVAIWFPAFFVAAWPILVVLTLCAAGFLLSVTQPQPLAEPGVHRLTRSHNQLILGVCAGIAEFLGWRPIGVRLLWLLLTLLLAFIGGIVIYLILAFIMPQPPTRGGKFRLEDFRVR